MKRKTRTRPLWRATSGELAEYDPNPFWAFPWAGGQALARHLLDHPELVRGRRVLDFATGSGSLTEPVLCGGTFLDAPARVVPGTRRRQTPAWQETDPQFPKSRWWLANGPFAGFRVVCVP